MSPLKSLLTLCVFTLNGDLSQNYRIMRKFCKIRINCYEIPACPGGLRSAISNLSNFRTVYHICLLNYLFRIVLSIFPKNTQSPADSRNVFRIHVLNESNEFDEISKKKSLSVNRDQSKFSVDFVILARSIKWWSCWLRWRRLKPTAKQKRMLFMVWATRCRRPDKTNQYLLNWFSKFLVASLFLFIAAFSFSRLGLDIRAIWMNCNDHHCRLQCQTYALTKTIPSIRRKQGKWANWCAFYRQRYFKLKVFIYCFVVFF